VIGRRKLVVGLAVAAAAAWAGAMPLSAAESGGIGGRFLLQDQFGRALTDQDFRGRYLLVTFGYTYCPDVCPTNLTTMTAALDLLGPAAEKIEPLFITVDPARDTPRQLGEYVKQFHPRLLGLGGSDEAVAQAAKVYRVKYRKVHRPGDPPDIYTVDHTASVFLMGPDGKFLAKFLHGTGAEEMARRIKERL
jgi:protein SCO1/2